MLPVKRADLVTKRDLQIELAPQRADISLIKWMLGILLGASWLWCLNPSFRCRLGKRPSLPLASQGRILWCRLG